MTRTPLARRGAALVLALLVIVAATAVAQATMVAAMQALRRVESQQAAMRESLAREALRARVDEHLRREALASVVGRDILLNGDTLWRAQPAGAGWFRIEAAVGGRLVAVALTAVPPWSGPCGGVLTAGAVTGSLDAVVSHDPATCPPVALLDAATFDSIAAIWRDQVARRFDGADQRLEASTPWTPDLFGEGGTLRVAAGTQVRGILWARVVILEAGVTVDGMVLARDSLVLGPGALVRADALEAVRAWEHRVRARLIGRHGALTFP